MVLVVGAGYLGNGETDVIFTGLRLSPMQWVRNCRTRRQFQEKWEEEEISNCFEKKSKVPDVEFSMWKMTMWAAYMGMKISKRNIFMQNQHISLYLRWWWWGWAEKRDKGVSPVPAAAVVALESELTVASTNAAPTLLLVVIGFCHPLSTEPTPNESDLNPIEQLKTDLNRKSLWKRTSTKLPLGQQTSPSSSSPPRLCCSEKTTSSSSSSSWRWSRCKDTSAQRLSKKLLNLKMIQGNR